MLTNKETAVKIAESMYINEPCRVCGELVSAEDFEDLIFAGYSENLESRTAHGKYHKASKIEKRVEISGGFAFPFPLEFSIFDALWYFLMR